MTEPKIKKSKSREDTIREALNKARRRSKDRTPEFATKRSMSFGNMRRRSAGSTNNVMMKESSPSQNKFILARSRGGKSSEPCSPLPVGRTHLEQSINVRCPVRTIYS